MRRHGYAMSFAAAYAADATRASYAYTDAAMLICLHAAEARSSGAPC